MISARNRRHRLWPLVAILSVSVTVLASGCLWGVVSDAETGDPLPVVTVVVTDANGNTYQTGTNASGLYAFDIADGPVPATGPATFELTAPGYEPLTATGLLIEYNDNPHASSSDLSSFWEIQYFQLRPEDVQWIEAEVQSVDIERCLLAPPGGVTDFVVGLRVYDPADPGGTLCSEHSSWFPISSTDPPPQALSILCAAQTDNAKVVVYVGVRRRWQQGAAHPYLMEEHDNSTASFEWTAPSLETAWRSATLDSTDPQAPDDPDMDFTAEIRYRSLLESPHWTP